MQVLRQPRTMAARNSKSCREPTAMTPKILHLQREVERAMKKRDTLRGRIYSTLSEYELACMEVGELVSQYQEAFVEHQASQRGKRDKD